MRFETEVIHAGVSADPTTGAVMTPIYQTSTYAQSSPGQHTGYEYSRTDNPTRTVLQSQLARLERADHALVFGSGLASTDMVLNLLKQGDHVVASDDLYGGTRRLYVRVAANRGIAFTFVDFRDLKAVEAALTEKTRLLWIETPTNPMLRVIDIAASAKLAHSVGAILGVDNTFLSPYFQNPLLHGADIVMHSVTKYINGHSDVVMGALAIKDSQPKWLEESIYTRLKFLQNAVGAVPGPQDCFLTLRGIKTLAIRMERHSANAAKIAKWLEGHAKVEKVLYTGLESHPGYELSRKQTRGDGGMVSFYLKGDLAASRRFLETVHLFTLAESLGGVESLIEHPAIMTHASVPADVREQNGIVDNFIRLSVGIENVDDLMEDLECAFKHA